MSRADKLTTNTATVASPREIPILFSAPMVRANRREVDPKTVTRRTRGLDKINAEPDAWRYHGFNVWAGEVEPSHKFMRDGLDHAVAIRCPYGVAGDRLWCKETLAVHSIDSFDRGEVGISYRADHPYGGDLSRGDGGYNFRSISANPSLEDPKWLEKQQAWARKHCGTEKWVPAIFMPRWASRDTLEVISTRPERLLSITREDALAEGIQVLPLQSADDPSAWYQSSPGVHQSRTPQVSYFRLWDEINGQGDAAKNKWVWRVEYRRIANA